MVGLESRLPSKFPVGSIHAQARRLDNALSQEVELELGKCAGFGGVRGCVQAQTQTQTQSKQTGLVGLKLEMCVVLCCAVLC